jgi:hypothetical protein
MIRIVIESESESVQIRVETGDGRPVAVGQLLALLESAQRGLLSLTIESRQIDEDRDESSRGNDLRPA